MQLLNGQEVAAHIKNRVSARVAELHKKSIKPGLAVVLVGEDEASKVYVNSKVKTCGLLGFHSEKYELPVNTSTDQLLQLIRELNHRDDIDGILVQMPLPKQIDTSLILESIDPAKDVDGFHAINVGKLVRGEDTLVACTPAGIIELFDYYKVPIEGANAVVVGRSDIVGKPMSLLLLHRNATVTICHSRTKNLQEVTKRADIVIAAIGRTAMITGDYIREGAVVIDVGINKVRSRDEIDRMFSESELPKRYADLEKKGYTLVGDVEPKSISTKASMFTPVPGGVGPLTIAMLMNNTLRAAEMRRKNF